MKELVRFVFGPFVRRFILPLYQKSVIRTDEREGEDWLLFLLWKRGGLTFRQLLGVGSQADQQILRSRLERLHAGGFLTVHPTWHDGPRYRIAQPGTARLDQATHLCLQVEHARQSFN